MIHCLKIEVLPGIYRRVPLYGTTTFGRDQESDIPLEDPGVSFNHATASVEDDRVFIQDLKSRNGTLVNDVIVHKRYLKDGDLVTLGYVNLVYNQENDPPTAIKVDQASTEEDDLVIDFSYHTMATFMTFLDKKMEHIFDDKEERDDIHSAITKAIDNAYLYGNKKNSEKKIQCHIQNLKDRFAVAIKDSGEGFDYKDVLNEILVSDDLSDEKGIVFLLKTFHSIEYNETGNEITLVKNLDEKQDDDLSSVPTNEATMRLEANWSLRQGYLAVKYCNQMLSNKSFPLQIVISHEEIKDFPKTLMPTTYFVKELDQQEFISVTPIVPGCICTPSVRELDVAQMPAKADFWITPLVAEVNDNSSIELKKDNKTLQVANIPFKTVDSSNFKSLLVLALAMPYLIFVMEKIIFSSQMSKAFHFTTIAFAACFLLAAIWSFIGGKVKTKIVRDTLEF